MWISVAKLREYTWASFFASAGLDIPSNDIHVASVA